VRIWRLLAAVLAVSVMIGGLLLVSAGPAAACTCVGRNDAGLAAHADAVFVGTLVSSRVDRSVLTREYRQGEEKRIKELPERFRRLTLHNLDPVVLTFEVSRVYKGAVGERPEIVIPPAAATNGGLCEFYVPAGPGPWLLVAHQSPDYDTFQLDRGQYLSSFSTLCGGSRALADGGEPALGGPPARQPSGPDSWPFPARLVVGVGVLAAGVAAGLGLATLRARRRASAD
jgi:hypothetical protein